jgi:hypothetical protein
MIGRDSTPAEIWREARQQCESKLFLVNRILAESGYGDLRDTERGRELVALAVLYEMGPGDTAYQIIDDLTPPNDGAGSAVFA